MIIPARLPDTIWRGLWSLRRAGRLSPTQRVFRELRDRGVPTKEMAAVEVFGGTGFRHTVDYLPLVGRLDVWEINPDHEATLRRNLPGARIMITDSFEEVRRTSERYGIIVVDNTITPFGKGHVEHFDLFPDIFRIAAETCVLLLNVCPSVLGPSRTDALSLSRRAAFYRTDAPLDIPIKRMVTVYADLMADGGLRLDWYFHIRRAYRTGIDYLVMRMSSLSGRPSLSDV